MQIIIRICIMDVLFYRNFSGFAYSRQGYFHTSNLKKYMGRLLFWAILSELPFNLMYSGSLIYPFHQNVLWTFLLGILCITVIEKMWQKGKPLLTFIVFSLSAVVAYVLGFLTMVDYFGYGIWMISMRN